VVVAKRRRGAAHVIGGDLIGATVLERQGV
jgi:hypothetical protein